MSTTVEECRPVSTASEWSDYNLTWLFDPDRYDHLPIEEQVKLYNQRDLKRTKAYKYAVQIWGPPQSRKRVMVAQPQSSEKISPRPISFGDGKREVTAINAPLKPKVIPEIPSEVPKELVRAREEKGKIDAYRDWINKRKSFRKDLDQMGLQQDWLSRKPDKTPLEQRVLTRMIEEATRRPPTPPPAEDDPVTPVMSDVTPTVRRPSPQAIKIIEKFLHKKKMRLIDLFQSVDKDKSWTVTRKEFRQAIKHYKVPISNVLLEDLILTLDADLNDVLDYREFATGMGIWKLEKRESKREMVSADDVNSSPIKFSKVNGYDPPAADEKEEAMKKEAKVQARVSSSSSSGSRHLEPPSPDTRAEQMILSSDEAMLDMRKQNRQVLSKYDKKKKAPTDNSVVKTMDSAADKHLIPTTLIGESAELLHKFRQLKFREYLDACRLCEESGVPLTETLLQRVLLYPSDKSHQQLKKNIRQPAMPLISKKFHERKGEIDNDDWSTLFPTTHKRSRSPPSPGRKSPKTKLSVPAGKLSSRNVLGTKSSSRSFTGGTQLSPRSKSRKQPLVDSRQAYMSKSSVKSTPSKQHLSTGKALISRKVDCWLTFEEYDRLTNQVGGAHLRIAVKSDDNAFWPGHLLDKLRLYLPEPEPKASAVFMRVPLRVY